MEKKKKLIIAGAIVGGLLVIYIGISLYFINRFDFRTTINGMDCAGKTAEQAKEIIASKAEAYELEILERDDKSEKISGADIDLVSQLDDSIDELMADRSGFAWPVAIFKDSEYTIDALLQYDSVKLIKLINDLDCLDEKNIIEPQDAKFTDYTKENGYKVEKEVMGNKLDKNKLVDAIKKSIIELEDELDLEEEECYINPTIIADSDEVKEALKVLNKYGQTEVTYIFGDNTEVINHENVLDFLSFDEDLNATLDKDKVKEYVNGLSEKYDTINKPKQLKTSYGPTVTVPAGSYGWQIDKDSEVATLISNIENGEVVKREPKYLKKANSHGANDYGNSYVEINIIAQHLFVYSNGALVLESPIVTGRLDTGHATPTGAYAVTYTQKGATLKGADYRVDVDYWMPFNGDIGMHDAPWMWGFGGEIYKTGGSHGCVNIRPAEAAVVFSYVQKGWPVLVYKLAGTETEAEQYKFDDEEENAENGEDTGENTGEQNPGDGTTPPATSGDGTTPPAPSGDGTTQTPATSGDGTTQTPAASGDGTSQTPADQTSNQ